MPLSVSGERLHDKLRRRISSAPVLAAMRRLPREKFLDASMLPYAGDDSALPIGHEQTTSAPFVIARMIEMMLGGKKPPLKILEVGSGCGYQTALLAEMGCEVIGLERLRPLAAAAAARLKDMGYDNAAVMHRDGFDGDAQNAPFDGIIVCAECASVPPQLPPQLQADGRLVMPLRRRDGVYLTAADAAGACISVRDRVRFVNMKKGIE